MDITKSKILAVIPARSGSKGFVRKNIALLSGEPLIGHSINHALKSKLVNRVIVSTGDSEISDISMNYRAEVVFRPESISTDTSPSEAAIIHVLDTLCARENYEPELVVFLQATSPCRRAQDIDSAILKVLKCEADSCFSACPEHFTGRWRLDSQGNAKPVNFKLDSRPMRQEYGIEYLENGNIYVFKPWVLRKFGARLGGKITIYPMGPLESLQVDCPEDLELIEQIFKLGIQQKYKQTDLSMLSSVALIVFDFDGVMTDNTALVDQNGCEAVFCNRGDGLGLKQLKKNGIQLLVLSTEANPVVSARCRKLRLDCIQDCDDKIKVIKRIASERSLSPEQIAYTGNDVNDLECMKWVGVPIAPSDASYDVLNIAKLITPQKGGEGVIRQIAEWVIKVK